MPVIGCKIVLAELDATCGGAAFAVNAGERSIWPATSRYMELWMNRTAPGLDDKIVTGSLTRYSSITNLLQPREPTGATGTVHNDRTWDMSAIAYRTAM